MPTGAHNFSHAPWLLAGLPGPAPPGKKSLRLRHPRGNRNRPHSRAGLGTLGWPLCHGRHAGKHSRCCRTAAQESDGKSLEIRVAHTRLESDSGLPSRSPSEEDMNRIQRMTQCETSNFSGLKWCSIMGHPCPQRCDVRHSFVLPHIALGIEFFRNRAARHRAHQSEDRPVEPWPVVLAHNRPRNPRIPVRIAPV